MNLVGKVVGLTRDVAAPSPRRDSENAFEPTDQGLLYSGYGDGMARAFEFALTPAIFCGIGYAIDRWLGTVPVFSIVLFLVSVAGIFAKTWYAYEARMQEQEAAAPWARTRAAAAPAAAPDTGGAP